MEEKMADQTKYDFNGKKNLAKNRMVLEVVKKYVEDNPGVSFFELQEVFYRKLQGSLEVVEKKQNIFGDKHNRYFMKDPIFLKSGDAVVVTTEWGIHNLSGFLEKAKSLNYEIAEIKDSDIKGSSSEIIKKYKKILRKKGLDDELYKWHLIKKYYGKPDAEADDFTSEIQSLNAENLVYMVALSAAKWTAERKTEEYRKCFQTLFDESVPLNERVEEFIASTNDLFNTIKAKENDRIYHDERTISVFLTYRFPEKYVFYKDSYYAKYCHYIGIKTKKAGKKFSHYLELIDDLVENYIKKDNELINMYRSLLTDDCFEDKNLKLLAQDILFRTLDGNVSKEEPIDEENEIKSMDGENKMSKSPLNLILYGPPGTGKTYNTINKALEIITETENDELELRLIIEEKEEKIKISGLKEIIKENSPSKKERKILQEAFKFFKEKGQIEFITFHQSYSYEDFVEGIKPLKPEDDDKFVLYDIKDGSFKELCLKAKGAAEIKKEYKFDIDKTNIWKMSLGDTLANENFVFDYCVKNDVILMGYGAALDYSSYPKERKNFSSKMIENYDDLDKKDYDITAIYSFINKVKIGDLVIISKGNFKIAGIAKVIGEYTYIKDEKMDDYVQSRKVEWLYISEDGIPYNTLLNKRFSQMTIYNLKSNTKIQELQDFLSKEVAHDQKKAKNYVLIIDEINRGNVASIFGELITLIEKDKRIGNTHPITAKLTYSNEEFGVPSNLHIIGTMNTADRSVEALDAALRRRFQFEEMMPEPELFDEDEWKWNSFDIKKLLKTINKRLEVLLDRDHQIGHSYFMVPENERTEKKLQEIFKYNIIPQLREYFFGDPEKIRLVLGNDFFDEEKIEQKSIFDEGVDTSEYIEEPEKKWMLKKSDDWKFEKYKEK